MSVELRLAVRHPVQYNVNLSNRYFSIMSITELHKLPAIEKLKIIEALWNDLVDDEGSLPELSWHETELKKTEEKFLAGSVEILDWQQAKKELRSQFEWKSKFFVQPWKTSRSAVNFMTAKKLINVAICTALIGEAVWIGYCILRP